MVWFVIRVTEGAVSWEEAWEMDYDDLKWTYAKCVEINEEIEKLSEGK